MKLPILLTAIAGLCGSAMAIPYTVPSNSAAGVDTAALQAGVTYLFEASGTYFYRNGSWADAEFSQNDDGTTEIYPEYNGTVFTENTDVLDIVINGGAVNWLGNSGSGWAVNTYSPDHVYRYYFVGTGASVKLAIADWNPLLSSNFTSDNSGSLRVDVTPVPDGGLTLMLLGLGLTGLAFGRRFLKA